MSGPKLYAVLCADGYPMSTEDSASDAERSAASHNVPRDTDPCCAGPHRVVPYIPARIDAATVERCAVALRERVAGPANAIGAEGHRVLRDAALAVLRAAGLEVES